MSVIREVCFCISNMQLMDALKINSGSQALWKSRRSDYGEVERED